MKAKIAIFTFLLAAASFADSSYRPDSCVVCPTGKGDFFVYYLPYSNVWVQDRCDSGPCFSREPASNQVRPFDKVKIAIPDYITLKDFYSYDRKCFDTASAVNAFETNNSRGADSVPCQIGWSKKQIVPDKSKLKIFPLRKTKQVFLEAVRIKGNIIFFLETRFGLPEISWTTVFSLFLLIISVLPTASVLQKKMEKKAKDLFFAAGFCMACSLFLSFAEFNIFTLCLSVLLSFICNGVIFAIFGTIALCYHDKIKNGKRKFIVGYAIFGFILQSQVLVYFFLKFGWKFGSMAAVICLITAMASRLF